MDTVFVHDLFISNDASEPLLLGLPALIAAGVKFETKKGRDLLPTNLEKTSCKEDSNKSEDDTLMVGDKPSPTESKSPLLLNEVDGELPKEGEPLEQSGMFLPKTKRRRKRTKWKQLSSIEEQTSSCTRSHSTVEAPVQTLSPTPV